MDARSVELEVLGEGGMGQVQRVRDDVLGRSVARKVMHPEIAERARRLLTVRNALLDVLGLVEGVCAPTRPQRAP